MSEPRHEPDIAGDAEGGDGFTTANELRGLAPDQASESARSPTFGDALADYLAYDALSPDQREELYDRAFSYEEAPNILEGLPDTLESACVLMQGDIEKVPRNDPLARADKFEELYKSCPLCEMRLCAHQ